MNELIFVGFGANKGSPLKQILDGLSALKSNSSVTNFFCSSIYSTPPLGPSQPDYLNGVCSFKFNNSPHELLRLLHSIELSAGRNRNIELRWGPRPLDLDILIFMNQEVDSQLLTIPHIGLLERGFVVIPMAEIAPNYILSNGKSAQEMAIILSDNQIKKVFTSQGAPIEDNN